MPAKRPKILAVSFALGPKDGSEAGAAWGVVRSLLKVADVDVLVPTLEIEGLRQWQRENNDERLRVIEVDTSQTSSILWRYNAIPKVAFLSYWMWLHRARKVGQKEAQRNNYAAAMHVAYGSYWLPSPVVDFGVPSIWGPVGGATRTPFSLWRYLGLRGIFGELFKYAMVRCVSFLPSIRHTWRSTEYPLAETENTRRIFPTEMQKRTRVINRAALQKVPKRVDKPRQPYIIFPSRVQPRKAPYLAVRALLHAHPDVKLRFVADGMAASGTKKLAKRLGLEDRVEFMGWVPREEMMEMMTEAAAAVFLGTREEGGCALAESMQLGTPVIVLGVGGARLLAETNTDPSRVRIIEPAMGGQPARDVGAAMTHFVKNLHPGKDGFLDRESMERKLLDVVEQACGLDAFVQEEPVPVVIDDAVPVA